MWLSKTVVSWLDVSLDTVRSLREEVEVLRAENALLKSDLQATRINSDWFRLKVNDLEVTNKALMERAYNVKLPVPQVVKAQEVAVNPYKLPEALFEHIDDDTAKSLGIS